MRYQRWGAKYVEGSACSELKTVLAEFFFALAIGSGMSCVP